MLNTKIIEHTTIGPYTIYEDKYSNTYPVYYSDSMEYVDEFESYADAEAFCKSELAIDSISKSQNMYEAFDKYCSKLPGKFYADVYGERKLASYNETVLEQFANSFHKKTGAIVNIESGFDSDGYYSYVDSVEYY